MSRYNYQCLAGHSGEVPEGSALEERCKAHQAKGFVDALILPYKECPQCVEGRKSDLRRMMEYCFPGCCKGECCHQQEYQQLEKLM